jgi:glycosyltransferase involved in cell wall biosynthesis
MPWLAKQFYRKADCIIAVSEGVADDLVSVAGLARSEIRVIYNPVVTPELVARAEEPLVHPWLVPGAAPVVLGAGRLSPQKDFATLLRAFAQVRAARPVRLIILGEGELRGQLEAQAAALGVSEDIQFPGFVDNPYAYMRRAGVFVLSSAWEGFGIVLVEAMACGAPVVSTDCPVGPAEILDGGRYGPLVPVGDGGALAQSILSMLDRPMDPERLRARAGDFALDKIGRQYLEVLCPR